MRQNNPQKSLKKHLFLTLAFSVLMFFLFAWQENYTFRTYANKIATNIILLQGKQLAALHAAVQSPFFHAFEGSSTLDEAGKMRSSSSPYFWLNSGGRMIISGGTGKTIQGELPALDKWRLAYALSNPADTDDGYHPQNILRLVTRSKWQNLNQEMYFKINKLNVSSSPNRNASNGVLFFNRYKDANTLYYTGVRVDGYAVIKKKINGVYYTMAYKSLFPITTPYNHNTNPNLLPVNTWMGLKSEVKNNADGTVSIKLYVDNGNTGTWTLAAEAIDNGTSYGGAAITREGYAGIRTDFMDAEFDNYKLQQ